MLARRADFVRKLLYNKVIHNFQNLLERCFSLFQRPGKDLHRHLLTHRLGLMDGELVVMKRNEVSRRVLLPALTAALAIGSGAYVTGIPVASKAQAQSSSCYATYWPNGRAVEIEGCEYTDGGSGYTILRNNTDRDMSVCWTLHYGNGRSAKGCNFRVRAHQEAKSSCHQCSHKNGGGLVDVTWREVKPSN